MRFEPGFLSVQQADIGSSSSSFIKTKTIWVAVTHGQPPGRCRPAPPSSPRLRACLRAGRAHRWRRAPQTKHTACNNPPWCVGFVCRAHTYHLLGDHKARTGFAFGPPAQRLSSNFHARAASVHPLRGPPVPRRLPCSPSACLLCPFPQHSPLSTGRAGLSQVHLQHLLMLQDHRSGPIHAHVYQRRNWGPGMSGTYPRAQSS